MSNYIQLKDGLLVSITSKQGKEIVAKLAKKSKENSLKIEEAAQVKYFDALALLESEAKAVLADFKGIIK